MRVGTARGGTHHGRVVEGIHHVCVAVWPPGLKTNSLEDIIHCSPTSLPPPAHELLLSLLKKPQLLQHYGYIGYGDSS